MRQPHEYGGKKADEGEQRLGEVVTEAALRAKSNIGSVMLE